MSVAVDKSRQKQRLSTREAKKQFLEKLPKNFFNITKTCKEVGIARATYYKWINRDKQFREKLIQLQEWILDDLEAMVFEKAFKEKDVKVAMWILERAGKHRGWSPKAEIEHSGEVTNHITLEIVRTDCDGNRQKVKEICSKS